MGLDVFFRRDIANGLRAAYAGNQGALSLALQGLDDKEKERVLLAYRQGYQAALVTVGLGFGLMPASRMAPQKVEATSVAIPMWVEIES